jgi:hypothetical protein
MKEKNLFIWIMALSLSLVQIGCGNSKERSPEQEAEPVEKIVKVSISPDLTPMDDLSSGDTLSIKQNESDSSYQLVIRRVQETIPGIMSISANVEDQDTGLATLIYRDGQLSGFMDMYKSNTRWQIEYDSLNSGYYLTKIDPDSIDELEGGEALSPPNEEY